MGKFFGRLEGALSIDRNYGGAEEQHGYKRGLHFLVVSQIIINLRWLIVRIRVALGKFEISSKFISK